MSVDIATTMPHGLCGREFVHFSGEGLCRVVGVPNACTLRLRRAKWWEHVLFAWIRFAGWIGRIAGGIRTWLKD